MCVCVCWINGRRFLAVCNILYRSKSEEHFIRDVNFVIFLGKHTVTLFCNRSIEERKRTDPQAKLHLTTFRATIRKTNEFYPLWNFLSAGRKSLGEETGNKHICIVEPWFLSYGISVQEVCRIFLRTICGQQIHMKREKKC